MSTDPKDKPAAKAANGAINGAVNGASKEPSGSADAAGERDATAEAFDRLERLMEFPTTLPLKIVGMQEEAFEREISESLARVAPGTRFEDIERRPSSGGQYLSLTFMVPVESRDQLEALHRELVAHPLVKVVL